ncbi:MAG: pyrimidine reductase family protein [Actinomycetales bacterium]|nr:MAG: pyrimidine reductase family protein [Actinomycetales bacterium]
MSGTLGGDADHRAFHAMRQACDVVVVGAGTARDEGYGPTDKPLVLVTRRLDVPEKLRAPGVLVLTTTDADAHTAAALESVGVEVLRHGEGAIDWDSALRALAARGWTKVLCEGGPHLHGELVEKDLVDEVCLTIAPALVAGGGLRPAHSDRAVRRDLRLAHVVEEDGVLLTRWVRDR